MDSRLCQAKHMVGAVISVYRSLRPFMRLVVCILSGQYGQFYSIWAHSKPQRFQRKTNPTE